MIESSNFFFFWLRCIIHQQCMAYFIFSFGISHSERPITAFLFPYSLNHRPGNDNAFPLFCHPNNQIPRKPKKNIFKLICVQEWGEKTTKVVDVYGNTINRKSSLIICYFSFFFFSSLRHIFFDYYIPNIFHCYFYFGWMNDILRDGSEWRNNFFFLSE